MKSKKRFLIFIFLSILIIIFFLYLLYIPGRPLWEPVYLKMTGQKTISELIGEIEAEAEERLRNNFKRKDTVYSDDKEEIIYSYPSLEFEDYPSRLTLLAFKREKLLEVWGEKDGKWYYILSYPILAASGGDGPKLKEGDRQVPEGIYSIIQINPNSYFHIAMLIDYPNNFDRKKAELDGRTNLGYDICIHGAAVSIGCIAIGDPAIEELFLMVEEAGMENVKVIIAPYDFRKHPSLESIQSNIAWLPELYDMIKKELTHYPIKKLKNDEN